MDADVIVVLKEGGVIILGLHRELFEQDGIFASISMWEQQVGASESLTCEAAASALEERMTTVEITAGTASARYGTHGVPDDGFSFEYGFSSQPPYWARAKARARCGCDVLSSSFHPRVPL
ncbi:hypothetical protein M405DRAFT_865010 [Rhizopogon salebrosus TDB-379]|nr:hypothetical protein M405DRAFT_865010 [Rhizopogon salebrosus TDB-379]